MSFVINDHGTIKQAVTDVLPTIQAKVESRLNLHRKIEKKSYLGLLWKVIKEEKPGKYDRQVFGSHAILQIASSVMRLACYSVRFCTGKAFWEFSRSSVSERAFTWGRDLVNVALTPVSFVVNQVAEIVGVISPKVINPIFRKLQFLELPGRERLVHAVEKVMALDIPVIPITSKYNEAMEILWACKPDERDLTKRIEEAYASGIHDAEGLATYIQNLPKW